MFHSETGPNRVRDLTDLSDAERSGDMFKTAITEMFGIRYPILCGAMMWICKPGLCAAVSNAGGMGNLTAGNYESEGGLSGGDS